MATIKLVTVALHTGSVQLSPSMAREVKRLIIHLADRGVRVGSAGSQAGYSPRSTRQDMKVNPAKYGISQATANLIDLDSPHTTGDAFDVTLTVVDRAKYAKAAAGYPDAFAYAEHVGKHYGLHLNRPLADRYASEKNHFVLTAGTVKALTPAALVRFARARKL